jgi:hypothetical protein
MADTKISGLTALTGANMATGDLVPVVDVSEGAADTANVKMLKNEFAMGIGAQASDYIVNNWYLPQGIFPAGPQANGIDTIKTFPIVGLRRRITISDLAVRIGTGTASQNIQLAIYAADKALGRPTGNPLGKTPNISVAGSSTTASGTLDAAVTLEASRGICGWLAINCSHASPTFVCVNANFPSTAAYVGSSTLLNILNGNTNTFTYLSIAQTFGTWPDLTGDSFTESTTAFCPIQAFKVSAVG